MGSSPSPRAAAVIVNAISKAKAPERVLSQRVQACEDRLNLMEGRMLTIEKASSAIEQSQKITQEALWALLGHAIDGNNVDDLKKAQAKLHDHIFSS